MRPQPGHEVYSGFVNLTLAACSMLSSRASWRSPWLVMMRLWALCPMSAPPAVMAARSWRSALSSVSKSRRRVSSWMAASASSRLRAASPMSSTRRRATGISASGSSESETRMVSPIPSVSSVPIPTADLMRPSSPSPASVTPRWRG